MSHRVKRAIVMAAGFGSRMQPVTLHTPKPLDRVGGERMIDTAIRGLHENGIEEIHIVVGYLGEQFYALEKEYPGVHIIPNPYYETCNNISSLYVAREFLGENMILDGDLMFYDSSVLAADFERSEYESAWFDTPREEWFFTLEGDSIVDCSISGLGTGWQLFSVSRWTAEDGAKLRRLVEYEFEVAKNWQIWWDNIALTYHKEEFRLGIRPIRPGAIVEIDKLSELAAIDPAYRMYLEEE